jgi:ABC-type transport system substrate-binding protein
MIVIYILLVVIVIQGIGIAYLWMGMQGEAPPTSETTLVVGIVGGIGRVLHSQHAFAADDPITNQIFEGLFAYDGVSQELVPHLASDFPTISANGLTYTIPLREGIKFHDGTPFNATAVKAHFDLLEELKKGSTRILYDRVSNCEIVDDYTVRFTLYKADSAFTAILAHFAAYIESPSAVVKYGKDNLNDYPIGSGPFKFVSKITDSEVILEANQEWWKLEPDESIEIDAIVFKNLADRLVAKLALENRELDAVIFGSVSYADYPDLLANPDLTSYDRTAVSPNRWMAFNLDNSTWEYFPNHKKLRQAFAYAINYENVINVALGGQAERLYSFIPPEYEGYEAVYEYDYNPTKSLELIAEAGFEPPLTINTWISDRYDVDANVFATIKDSALEAGFDLNIQQAEHSAYRQDYYHTSKLETAMWSWQADFLDEGNWLENFMATNGFSLRYSTWNNSDIASLYPEVDNLIAEAAATTDQTRKLELCSQIQQLWAEWLPNIHMFRLRTYEFTHKSVEGVLFGAMNWDIKFYATTITS